MAVDDDQVVDSIGVEKTTGIVVLTIADHLEWDGEWDHLVTLQNKLNAYLRFIESGEILESYPDAKQREPRIDVVFRVPPTSTATRFLERACETLRAAGIGLAWRVLET